MGLLVYPYCLVNTLLVTCDCDTVWGLIGGYYAVWSPQSLGLIERQRQRILCALLTGPLTDEGH